MSTTTAVESEVEQIDHVLGEEYEHMPVPLLGILVPPIGAIILVDQYMVRANSEATSEWRIVPFIAWAAGSLVAFFVSEYAPQYSTAISASSWPPSFTRAAKPGGAQDAIRLIVGQTIGGGRGAAAAPSTRRWRSSRSKPVRCLDRPTSTSRWKSVNSKVGNAPMRRLGPALTIPLATSGIFSERRQRKRPRLVRLLASRPGTFASAADGGKLPYWGNDRCRSTIRFSMPAMSGCSAAKRCATANWLKRPSAR